MKIFPVLFVILLIPACGSSLAQSPTTTSTATFWQASLAEETKQDYPAALQQMKSFQQAGGDPFLANLRSGWLSYLNKDYPAALESYHEASRLQPSALNPLLGLLVVSEAQDDASGIRRTVDVILHVDPLNYRAQMAAASLEFKAQDYREALSYYRRVLQYYPDDLEALSGKAWCLCDLGLLPDAALDFQLLLSLNTAYPNARQGLALCQARPSAPPALNL